MIRLIFVSLGHKLSILFSFRLPPNRNPERLYNQFAMSLRGFHILTPLRDPREKHKRFVDSIYAHSYHGKRRVKALTATKKHAETMEVSGNVPLITPKLVE